MAVHYACAVPTKVRSRHQIPCSWKPSWLASLPADPGLFPALAQELTEIPLPLSPRIKNICLQACMAGPQSMNF